VSASKRVAAAREVQAARFAALALPNVRTNAQVADSDDVGRAFQLKSATYSD
jgi:hypothetical protein